MRRRVNKGWLQLNDQDQLHYWLVYFGNGLWYALCGRMAIPEKIREGATLPRCELCARIRQAELDAYPLTNPPDLEKK